MMTAQEPKIPRPPFVLGQCTDSELLVRPM
jgi:hypothetical protein